MYLGIKTFWNILGSVVLPIRGYAEFTSKMFSNISSNLDNNVFEKIKCGSNTEEYGDPNFGSLCLYLGDIMNLMERVSIIKNIDESKLSDIQWCYLSLMKSSMKDIIDNEVPANKYSKELHENIKIIYNSINKEEIDEVNKIEFRKFIIIIINTLIYRAYTTLCDKYMELIVMIEENRNDKNVEIKEITYENK